MYVCMYVCIYIYIYIYILCNMSIYGHCIYYTVMNIGLDIVVLPDTFAEYRMETG